jgi:hypothetical protein
MQSGCRQVRLRDARYMHDTAADAGDTAGRADPLPEYRNGFGFQ